MVDEDDESSMIDDEQDEVEMQVKEPALSAIRAKEFSVLRNKEGDNNPETTNFGNEAV